MLQNEYYKKQKKKKKKKRKKKEKIIKKHEKPTSKLPMKNNTHWDLMLMYIRKIKNKICAIPTQKPTEAT